MVPLSGSRPRPSARGNLKRSRVSRFPACGPSQDRRAGGTPSCRLPLLRRRVAALQTQPHPDQEDIPRQIEPVVTEHAIHRDFCQRARSRWKPLVPDVMPGGALGHHLGHGWRNAISKMKCAAGIGSSVLLEGFPGRATRGPNAFLRLITGSSRHFRRDAACDTLNRCSRSPSNLAGC